MGTKSIDRDDSTRLMVFAGTSSKALGQRIAEGVAEAILALQAGEPIPWAL